MFCSFWDLGSKNYEIWTNVSSIQSPNRQKVLFSLSNLHTEAKLRLAQIVQEW